MQYALPAGAGFIALFKEDAEGVAQLATSGAVTLGTTTALKYAVDEKRPNGGHYSFPSGHTSLAFAGAAFIHDRYGWEWGLPAQLAAAAVAWSRVDARKHYWYDVLASVGIAHASAFLLVDHKDSSVTLFPMVGGRKPSFGIVGSIKF